MPISDDTENEIIVVVLLSILYLTNCDVNLWTAIFIVDDILSLLEVPTSLEVSRNIYKAVLFRLWWV